MNPNQLPQVCFCLSSSPCRRTQPWENIESPLSNVLETVQLCRQQLEEMQRVMTQVEVDTEMKLWVRNKKHAQLMVQELTFLFLQQGLWGQEYDNSPFFSEALAATESQRQLRNPPFCLLESDLCCQCPFRVRQPTPLDCQCQCLVSLPSSSSCYHQSQIPDLESFSPLACCQCVSSEIGRQVRDDTEIVSRCQCSMSPRQWGLGGNSPGPTRIWPLCQIEESSSAIVFRIVAFASEDQISVDLTDTRLTVAIELPVATENEFGNSICQVHTSCQICAANNIKFLFLGAFLLNRG